MGVCGVRYLRVGGLAPTSKVPCATTVSRLRFLPCTLCCKREHNTGLSYCQAATWMAIGLLAITRTEQSRFPATAEIHGRCIQTAKMEPLMSEVSATVRFLNRVR